MQQNDDLFDHLVTPLAISIPAWHGIIFVESLVFEACVKHDFKRWVVRIAVKALSKSQTVLFFMSALRDCFLDRHLRRSLFRKGKVLFDVIGFDRDGAGLCLVLRGSLGLCRAFGRQRHNDRKGEDHRYRWSLGPKHEPTQEMKSLIRRPSSLRSMLIP
jgi:hypothetical protein